MLSSDAVVVVGGGWLVCVCVFVCGSIRLLYVCMYLCMYPSIYPYPSGIPFVLVQFSIYVCSGAFLYPASDDVICVVQVR